MIRIWIRIVLSIALTGWLLACAGPSSLPSVATMPDIPPTAMTCPTDRPPAGLSQPVDIETERRNYPEATAATWADGALWTANESGLLTRWNTADGSYKQYRIPNGSVVRSLATVDGRLVVGADDGLLWLFSSGRWHPVRACANAAVISIAQGSSGVLWCACPGEGLTRVTIAANATRSQTVSAPDKVHNAAQRISAVAYDPARATVWIATHSGELLCYNTDRQQWTKHLTLPGYPAIYALLIEPDSSVWAATSSGLYVYQDGTVYPCLKGFDVLARSLARAADGTIWVAGDDRIARISNCGASPSIYTDADNPVLLDRHRLVVLDETDLPWFIGRHGKIRFGGTSWTAINADVRRRAQFAPAKSEPDLVSPPRSFPAPRASYVDWLRTWPRPSEDNGRGMHFLQTHQYDAIEAQHQINRLVQLNVKWATVIYRDHIHLKRTAPLFQASGITVIWRPFVRPYQSYISWAEDVAFLRQRGIAPYMQLYNEPELEQEWENVCAVNQEVYLRMLLLAVQQVYDAGGYVGLQFITPEWLRATLRAMKTAGMHYIFDRMFFIPHLHGLNHPPDYTEDIHGVLGFREFAQVFTEELGFVPVMIAGEGGWRLGEQQDNRFPAITEALHRDYHLGVFNWFRTGRLSNGEPLPDYLFAFCPWLISDPIDPAAWFDSAAGNRQLTIEAVASMPAFERKFSWDR
ncbi:MAG: hypothetical protein ACUVSF_11680 [Anaerolineae bacterium]